MYKFIHEKSTSALSYGYLCLRFFIFGCCLLRVIIIQSVHLFQLFTKEIVLEQNTLATSIENPKQERYAFLHWMVWSESDGFFRSTTEGRFSTWFNLKSSLSESFLCFWSLSIGGSIPPWTWCALDAPSLRGCKCEGSQVKKLLVKRLFS